MNGNWFNLFWVVFLVYSLLGPLYQRRRVNNGRFQVIRSLERGRRSRMITMIHRQEAVSILGIPLARYINIEDSEAVLRAIRLTPDGMPIDLILHTPGGLVLAAEQIATALKRHQGKVTVFVPHYAMSGGTMLALAADEIRMDEHAVLGPVDPQLGQYPAASIIKAVEQKPTAEVDDSTLILADVARKAMDQVRSFVTELLEERLPDAEAARVAEVLTAGGWTHDFPITVERLRKLGLPVVVGLPPEIYALMDLYPQAGHRRPSVEYIPVPYEMGPRPGR